MIIGISGKMGSGKSTLANGIEHWARLNGKNVIRLKFADPLYSAVNRIYEGLNLQPKKDRKLLQFIGYHFRNEIGPTFWANTLVDSIVNEAPFNDSLIIIDDLRYPEEAAVLKERGAVLIRLECPEEERNFRIGNMLFVNKDHESETALDAYTGFNYKYDSNLIESPALVKSVVTNLFKVK